MTKLYDWEASGPDSQFGIPRGFKKKNPSTTRQMLPAKGPIWDQYVDEQRRRVDRRQAYTEEARLMELLADEEQDEEKIPDAGELEGSGDDFDGWQIQPISLGVLI